MVFLATSSMSELDPKLFVMLPHKITNIGRATPNKIAHREPTTIKRTSNFVANLNREKKLTMSSSFSSSSFLSEFY